MLTFYLKFHDINDPIKIGTESFDNFWCDQGWDVFIDRIHKTKVEGFEIIDNTAKKYSPVEFVEYLKKKKLNIIEG